MERRPVYSIFPAPPASHPASQQQKSRQSAESRTRPSLEQPPYPPPSSPLPPIPTSHAANLHPAPTSTHQPLPPTPDSLRPTKLPTRRKLSPNREFADFQRELAQSSSSSQQSHPPPSPARGRPTSPRQRPPSKQTHRKVPSSGHSRAPSDPPDHDMQSSTLSTSSTSSLSLAKPPLLSPSTTVAPSPPLSTSARHHRPNTVYFHGSIGGAGNYRKVIRENNKAPRAYAENAVPAQRRSSPTRFLSKLMGNQKGRSTEAVLDERASGSEESVREEVPVDLGAAEALRRKMMGVGRRKKGGA